MNILSKVPFEGIPENIAINPNLNQIFTSENYANLISVVDFDSRSKTSIIEIKQPREIFFDPEKNRIYAVFENGGFFIRGTGKKLGVIDLNSNQIIKVFGENEGFAGISRNSENKKIYVTQPNKKKIWVIDEKSLEVEEKINVKGHYKKIIFAKNKGEIILGNHSFLRGPKIISFNINTNEIRKIFSIFVSDSVEGIEMKYFPEINKMIVQRSEVQSEMGGSIGHIDLVDFNNPKIKNELDAHNVLPYFDLSISKENFYYIQKNYDSELKDYKFQLVKLNLVTKNRQSCDFDLGRSFSESYMFDFEKFLIHPKTGNLIIFGFYDDQIQLHELSLP